MSTFLFHTLSFHLILQNKGVYIWFFLSLLFLFVFFSVFFFLKGYIFVPCLIHGDLSSFQFASIRQMLCRIRSFYFFISFLLSILLASHLRPVSLSEACVSEWKLHFSGYKLLGSRVCAIRWHDLGGRDLVGISVFGHPHPVPGWVTAKVFTPKRERMRIQGWFTNQRFRITIHTSYFLPTLSTLRFWVRLACLLTPC